MAVIVNGGTGGDLNPGLNGTGGPVATTNAIVRRTTLSSNLGDALGAQVSYGWDQVAGTSRLLMPTANGISLGGSLDITMGAGNNQRRFTGTIRQFDTTLAPHVVTAIGKGPLYALEEFKNDVESTQGNTNKAGYDLADLLGTPTGTLQQIVTAVLGMVGVNYSGSNLDDPSHVYGLDGLGKLTFNDALVWGTHETAAAYLHRFLEASEGYRLFDSADGNVYLKQILATPGNDPLNRSGVSFTLGEDIFPDSNSSISNLGQVSAVLVEGWDDGSGPATSGIVGSGNNAYRVFSNLIESDAFAQSIASYWLSQVSRVQRIVRLTTPRDDLIGPGMTVDINAAGGLGIVDTMWVKSVTTEVAASGAFSQQLVCVVS